jgi:hypothetical protein
MEISTLELHDTVTFRFFADFDVKVSDSGRYTGQQLTLMKAIMASPSTLKRIGCMTIETDLAGISGAHLEELFRGPEIEEILECVLPVLPDTEKRYWTELRHLPGEALHYELMPVFLSFRATLRRAGIEELSSADAIKMRVGPTIEAPTQG